MTVVPIFASAFDQPAVLAALGAAPLLYFATLAIGRWLKRKHGVPLGLMFQLLCISLAAYVPLRVLHAAQHPEGHANDPAQWWHDEGIRAFHAALIILGVIFALQLLRSFYWQRWFSLRHGAEAPKLLQQVFGFAVFCVALALVLRVAYGFRVDAFLAGSGIVAVVIGLAMQETLANIVSGIALQFGKPFLVGDWLIVDSQRAEVIEMNWRSTKLRTNDDYYVDIPNKAIVSHTITNLSYPTKTHSNRIRIGFEYTVPPNHVRELLRRATANAPGVLDMPPPKVFLKEFGESAIIYEIKYSLDDERRFNDIEDAIRTNVWYEARRAGLAIPFPMRTVEVRRHVAGSAKPTSDLREKLARQELLAPLDDEQKNRLLDHARLVRFGRGEKVIRQGSEGCSMFVIVHGEVDVVIHANGTDTTVATLHPGEAFGEMCLLTGEKRSATVLAKSDCELWEIDRAHLQPLIQENQALAERLSEMLARRQMMNEGVLAAQTPAQVVEQKRKEYTVGFRKKIRSLFEI
ncbi:MAG: mechanosensitive ion channel family protein [Chthoniobacteraceae bacterium]